MFLSSKTLCTYTILSNFCKVTASMLKWLSFSDKEIFSFEAMNSSKWLQLFQGFAEYSWLIKFEAHLMALRTNDQFWNTIPTKKQSLIFCFLKESCICWHISFSFVQTSSIIINWWFTLHGRVHWAVSSWKSSQTWNEVIPIDH